MNPGFDGFVLPKFSTADELSYHFLRLLQGNLNILPRVGIEGRKSAMSKYTDKVAPKRISRLIRRIMSPHEIAAPNGRVCIVVRTYSQHLKDPIFSLKSMIESLIGQTYESWEAFIVNTDQMPMEGLYSLLAGFDDPRLRVVETIGGQNFTVGTFPITDRVISEQCPVDSDWLLATNGDNWYDPKFFEHLDLSKDIIAYDFYSRSVHILDQEIVGTGCSMYFNSEISNCKTNQLKHWHTDLGSNVLNYKRWMFEERNFSDHEIDGDGSADGYTIESLVYYDWSVKKVGGTDGCLMSHSPNLNFCLRASDDTFWIPTLNQCVYVSDPEDFKVIFRKYEPYWDYSAPFDVLGQGRCLDLCDGGC